MTDGAILALDLGTRTGWALRHADGRVESGVLNLKPKRHEGFGVRFYRLRRWLTATKNRAGGELCHLTYEHTPGQKARAAHIAGAFEATVTSWCEHHDIPYRAANSATVKKHATGKGNADKAAVEAAVRAKGFDPETHDEADALAILDLALCRLDADYAANSAPLFARVAA